MRFPTILQTICLLLAAAVCGCEETPQKSPDQPALPSFSPNEMILSGIRNPKLIAAKDARIDPEAEVIGVSVGNTHRAYLIAALDAANIALTPQNMARFRKHIVNDIVNGKPVTVTYCDRTKCTRVFTDRQSKSPLHVGLAGYRDEQMLLHYQGKTYSHRDKSIPLEAQEYAVMKWKDWKRLHPESKVYVGTPGL